MLTSASHPSNKVTGKRFRVQLGSPQVHQNKAVGLVTRGLRERVVAHATDLFAGNDERNYVEVIAKREGIPTWTVSQILTGELLAYQRYAKTLEHAIRNGLEMATKAESEVWEDFL